MRKWRDRESLIHRAVEMTRMMVRCLVDDENAIVVQVEDSPSPRHVFLFIRVADKDVGYVFGREGRNINAMRAILECMFTKEHMKVELESDQDERNGALVSADEWRRT